MGEVILDGGETVDVGVDERRRFPEPPPDPVHAPKGWRRDRLTKQWVPRLRAPKQAEGESPSEPPAPPGDRADSAWAAGPDGRELLGDDDDDNDNGYVPLTDEQRNDVEAILEFVCLPAITAASARDPHCGGVLYDNWDNIREKSLPIIARSPALVEWMTKAGGARDWLLFGAALRPVGKAIWDHHITKTVSTDDAEHDESLGAYTA